MHKVDAETARLAVALDVVPAFRIWTIARCDSGVIALDALVSRLEGAGVSYAPRYLKALLRAGEGVFWTYDRDRLFIRSQVNVAVALVALAHSRGIPVENNKPGVRPVWVSFAGSIGDVRANLFAAWCEHRKAPTISQDELGRLFNVERHTITQWARAAGIELRQNYAQTTDKDMLPDHAGHAYQYLTRDGDVRWTWRMANTYVPKTTKLHTHKGKARKIRTAVNAVIETPRPGDECPAGQRNKRLYHTDAKRFESKKKRGKLKGYGYVFVGVNRHNRNVWDYRANARQQTTANERMPLRREYAKERDGSFTRLYMSAVSREQWGVQKNLPYISPQDLSVREQAQTAQASVLPVQSTVPETPPKQPENARKRPVDTPHARWVMSARGERLYCMVGDRPATARDALLHATYQPCTVPQFVLNKLHEQALAEFRDFTRGIPSAPPEVWLVTDGKRCRLEREQ